MMRGRAWVLSALAAALVSPGGVGCTNLYRFQHVEHATVTRDGRLWLAGSEGFAAARDARGARRLDYATSAELEDPFYRGSLGPFPAARIVEAGGAVHLITRAGDRFRWSGRGWRRAPLDLGQRDTFAHQLDFAAATSGGQILLYSNDGRLLWVDPSSGTPVAQERLFGHVHPMALDGDQLAGVGFEGLARTIVRRTGTERWEKLATLPERPVLAFGRVRGEWVAVLDVGLVVVDDGGAARFIGGRELFGRAAVSAPPDPGATRTLLPAGTPLAEARIRSGGFWSIEQAFFLDGGGLVLAVRDKLVVLDGPGPWVPRPCDEVVAHIAAAARLADGHTVVVSPTGALFELGANRCREISTALTSW